MAKKAKDEQEEVIDKSDYRKAVQSLIKKQFGENLIKSGTDFIKNENAKKIISISPSLDLGCGGGVPEGSWVIFSGKHKCGKTVTLLHFAKKCQDAGKHVYYLNIEGRLKKMNLIGYGLREDMLDVIESTEDKFLSAQDFLNIAEHIIRTHPGCLIIFDSYSMLCHSKEQAEGVDTSTMGAPAALLAQFFRQMAQVVPTKRTIVAGINQIMANIGWGKSGDTEKGGKAIQFQGDVKFRHKTSTEWKEGDKEVGKKVTWVVEFNALGNGAVPGSEIESYMRYGHGIDEIQEVVEIGKNVGLIEQGGAWYTLSFAEKYIKELGYEEWNDETVKLFKCQGASAVSEKLKENQKLLEFLRKDISEMLV